MAWISVGEDARVALEDVGRGVNRVDSVAIDSSSSDLVIGQLPSSAIVLRFYLRALGD